MVFFEWEKRYTVNIEVIDSQHQQLFNIINRFHATIEKGLDHEKISKLIKELSDYTRYHFREEEVLMERANYHDLESHKKAHQVFIDKVDEQKKLLESNDTTTVALELSIFLRNWLIEHIVKTDKQYSLPLNEYGIK